MPKMNETIIKLDTQINGVDGKGGIMNDIAEIKSKLDSLHTKFTFGIGFLAAVQVIIKIFYPVIAKALNL